MLIKKKTVFFTNTFLVCFFNLSISKAELTAVIDEAVLEQVQDQVGWAEDQYNKLSDQYTKLSETHEALTEIEDFSDAFEFIRDVRNDYGNYQEDFWDWTPSLEELEEMAEGGLDESSVNDQITYYNKKYGDARSPEYFSDDPNSTSAILKSDSSKSSRYGMGVSHEAWNKSEDFQEQYQKLLNEFKDLDSQKKSTDFGNHQLLQMTQMMNEMIKLQSLQLYLLAQDKKDMDFINEINAEFINSPFTTSAK